MYIGHNVQMKNDMLFNVLIMLLMVSSEQQALALFKEVDDKVQRELTHSLYDRHKQPVKESKEPCF